MLAIHATALAAGIEEPVYVADNATAHGGMGRDCKNVNLRYETLPIPARSPDFNKVAEHAVANVKAGFYRLLYTEAPAQLTPARAQMLLRAAFEKSITRKAVAADIDSMALTLQVIAAEEGEQIYDEEGKCHTGTGGDWPPKPYR